MSRLLGVDIALTGADPLYESPFMSLPENIFAPIAAALTAKGYENLTPVQSAVIEDEADGRDLLVSAQTGSGKTVAFGMAIAPTLLDGAEILPMA